jgi:hypothetical protein
MIDCGEFQTFNLHPLILKSGYTNQLIWLAFAIAGLELCKTGPQQRFYVPLNRRALVFKFKFS